MIRDEVIEVHLSGYDLVALRTLCGMLADTREDTELPPPGDRPSEASVTAADALRYALHYTVDTISNPEELEPGPRGRETW